MPTWKDVSQEVAEFPNPLDAIRRKYLALMHEYTGRNVIAYYSSFIQRPGLENGIINDEDKNAFMQCVHKLDKKIGLDLILHTPGGDIAATESLVTYLKKIFGNDIRVFIPQIAMSAGTMISLSAKEIVMGKQSNLGPIDPQYGGLSCAGVIEEFEQAVKEITANPAAAAVWQPIIGKYHPTFLGDCSKAIKWSTQIVSRWLQENMLKDYPDKERDERAKNIVDKLASHADTYSHSRHIDFEELKELGVNVVALENLDNRAIDPCKDLQDCVLTLHHSYMRTFEVSSAAKIVENDQSDAMIMNVRK